MTSHKIAILYGSETGNTQDFANILSYRLQRLHFPHTLSTLGDYDPLSILKARYVFILASTTGQGELTRNVHEASYGNNRNKTLWSFLKKKNLPSDFLNHLSVAFFGLGDSSYPKFNYAIRKLHNRMVTQLGANELFDRLEGDEQCMAGSNKGTGSGVESVYFEYEKRVIQFLMEKFPHRKSSEGNTIPRVELDDEIYLRPKSYLRLAKKEVQNIPIISDVKFKGDDSVNYGRVKKNERITSKDHFQDVRRFVFENTNKDEKAVYYPGDTACIFPCNHDRDVNALLENQDHWKKIADRPLEFTNGIPEHIKEGGIVEPLTLRNILKYHCDIMSIPRASFFMKTWTFATDVSRMERGEGQVKDQRDKLKEFAYDQDMQDLYDYCNRPRRSIVEVLEDFLSVRLPWEYCLDYFPIIRPRYYSISSEPCNSQIELTMAIVQYRTILKNVRYGACTSYIAELEEDETIRYKLQKNNLINKKLIGKPMILVSPGVGLAPLMSVIRSNPPLSNNIHLFFGCRFKDKDYLYKDILEKWADEKKITLHPVFSRDRENSPDTKYVQDVLWKLGEQVTNLIVKENASMFLCGSSGKMPVQVRLTFIEMLKKWGSFSDEEEAKSYLKLMEKEDRYLQETW